MERSRNGLSENLHFSNRLTYFFLSEKKVSKKELKSVKSIFKDHRFDNSPYWNSTFLIPHSSPLLVERTVIFMKEYLLDEAAVFSATDHYDIIWNTTEKGLAYVECGGKKFYDHANGNVKSEETVHKVSVPKNVLDEAKEYTINFREVYERKPYFPTSSEDLLTKTYSFRPVTEKENYNFYFISDTHNNSEYASNAAAPYSDKIDFLVLGGDVPDKSDCFESIRTVFKICASVTKGEIPVINARGNHDTRGYIACDFYKYTATQNGEMFYTVRLGKIFAIVLDCGEDKTDDHKEYGYLAAFEPYRERVTEFLRDISVTKPYNKDDIVLVFCHERPDARSHGPFKEIYGTWTKYLNEIKPKAYICGHEHTCEIFEAGRQYFDTDIICEFPSIVGSQVRGNKCTTNADLEPGFTGAFYEISENSLAVSFTDDKGNSEKHIVK